MKGDVFVVRRGEDGWLPNLVAGVSVWRLAPDLNEAELFAGRLLEPEVDGPDALPDVVEWDLTGLLPLGEARARHPAGVEAAIRDFLGRVERSAELFETKAYARFRVAFTLPSLEAEEHWFYDPRTERLRVMRWGARARGLGAQESKVYGPSALLEAERVRRASQQGRRGSALGRRGLVLGGVLCALFLAAVALFALLRADGGPGPSRPVAEPSVEVRPEPAPSALEPRAPSRAPPPASAEVPPPIPAVHRRVYFDVGQHSVRTGQRESLEVIRAHLEAHPRLRQLLVEGHADARGDDADNLPLSQRRSVAVMTWLESHGVAHERLRGSGCSERYHAVGSGADDLRANRRVEVYVLDPPPVDGVRRHEGCTPVSW